MLGSLFAHLDAPPAPARVRLRQRRHECGHYIRYPGKGTKYQVRWWLGGHGSVNCGLYDSEATAELVRRELIRETAGRPATPLGIWQALQCVLARLGTRAGDVSPALPTWVAERKDGGYGAKVKKGGRVLECPGPFADPAAAHVAMLELLDREFPPAKAERPAPLRVLTLADVLAAA
ncbi:hypothetical protein [Gemmata sp.]|uniref:hypothetical protein n=1 Tax=Gemmata sp. TaxID=1914242 RepID=UPI003F72EA42